jgi:hypothetical protein
MLILITTLVSAIVGFGSAFYIERIISKKMHKKSQRVLSYIAMISFAVGFTGLLNQVITHPMVGLTIDFNKVIGYLVINMLILPAFFYIIAWLVGRIGKSK